MRWSFALCLALLLPGLGIAQVPDFDGDAFSPPEDCNDMDARVYPGAPELCDALDNDCNVSVDEHVTRPCENNCAQGVEFCSNGIWLGCTAAPCCDHFVGEGGEFPAICPAAEELGSSSPAVTLCVSPGSYTAPCTVGTNLISTGGRDLTSIIGDVHIRGRSTNVNTRIQGFTIIGNINRDSFDAGPDLFDNHIIGTARVVGPYIDGVCRYAIGNQIEGRLTGLLGYFIYRNWLEGEGLTAAGDFVNCDAVVENTILNTETAISAVESIGTFVIRGNQIENCDTGIRGRSSMPPLRLSTISANTIKNCRIGIDFSYALEEEARIWNNRILGAREYGMRILGRNVELGQNLIVGTGSLGSIGDPGVAISLDLLGGLTRLLYNTITENRAGIEIRPPEGGSLVLSGNIVASNQREGIRIESPSPEYPLSVDLSLNDVFGNDTNWVGVVDPTGSNGNLMVDPQFVAPSLGDFRLAAGSPLVDHGEPFGVSVDISGSPRTQDGDLDGVPRPDLGAFELSPQIVASVQASHSSPARGSRIASCVSVELQQAEEALGSYQATLAWNPSVLSLGDVKGGVAPFDEPVVEITAVGKIQFSDSSLSGVSGSAKVLCAEFEVVGDAGTTSALDLELISLSSPGGSGDLLGMAASRDAALSVVTSCIVGDVSGDDEIRSQDATLVLSNEVELSLPETSQMAIAARCGDASGDATTNSIDANIILSARMGREIDAAFPFGLSNQAFDSCLSKPAESEAEPSVVSDTPEATLTAIVVKLLSSVDSPRQGEEFEVALAVDLGASGKRLGSYGVSLTWNPDVAAFLSLDSGGSSRFNSPVGNVSKVASGELRMAEANPLGAEGTVVLVRTRFRALRDLRRPTSNFMTEFSSMGSTGPKFEDLLAFVKRERPRRREAGGTL